MEKFAVDLDKVLDELEQSEGLFGERFPETQHCALDLPRPATQGKCRSDVPRQNGDHSVAPAPIVTSGNAHEPAETKNTNDDATIGGEAHFWDDISQGMPNAAVKPSHPEGSPLPVSHPSSLLEDAADHPPQDCLDCSSARSASRGADCDVPSRVVRGPAEADSVASGNAILDTGNGPSVSVASNYDGSSCNGQAKKGADQPVLVGSAVIEQSTPSGLEPRTVFAASETVASRVCGDGVSKVSEGGFPVLDLLSLSPSDKGSEQTSSSVLQPLVHAPPNLATPGENVTELICDSPAKNGGTVAISSMPGDVPHQPQEASDSSKAVTESTPVFCSGAAPVGNASQAKALSSDAPASLAKAPDSSASNEQAESNMDYHAKPTSHQHVTHPPDMQTEPLLKPASSGLENVLGSHDGTLVPNLSASKTPTKGADILPAKSTDFASCEPSAASAGQPNSARLEPEGQQTATGVANTSANVAHVEPKDQQVAAQSVAQDSSREADVSSTSPSDASSALPATPSASPPRALPEPSSSPPRSSSAPPGALPASPARLSSASSSPVSSASTGPSAADLPDDAIHSENAFTNTDEATMIADARSLDEGTTVVGFDTVPDVTDEELDRLLQEEEGGEGERNFLPPLSEEEQMLGRVKPFWIPDEEAPACMLCFGRFTVLKRRHHCRACGKVLCSSCCNQKAPLPCLENREGRVCLPCLTVLQRVAAVERLGGGPSPANPAAYCSRGPPPLHGSQQSPPLTVLVPVLRRGPRPDGEAPKQVMFSDGIRPGGDLSDEGVPPQISGPPREPSCREGPAESLLQERRVVLSDIEGSLPPVALSVSQRDLKLENEADLLVVLQDPNVEPVAFALTRNLHVLVKIVTVDCGGPRQCWNFCSRGLAALGMDEVVFLLEREPGEAHVPRDALRLYTTLQSMGAAGGAGALPQHRGAVGVAPAGTTAPAATTVGAFQSLPFPEGLLGSSDHGGFLLLPHMGQCLDRLVLPRPPWLCALLLQRLELPWARLLPLRLLLRLGAEFEVYPYPMVSVRGRRSVYAEVGHTIMTVLLDFRNFQYQLASLSGLLVHLEGRQTTVRVPRNRYDALVHILDGNEHVLALAGNLSPEADAHLVCVQAPEGGTYHSQALQARPGSAVECTGASFVVFSGALKGPGEAKHSVVEDGVLVQLSPTSMGSLRTALRAMRDWHVPVVPASPAEEAGHIAVLWTEDDRPKNAGVCSPIDGRSLEGLTGVRLRAFSDFCARGLCLRWTEFFLLSCDGPTWGGCEDPQRAAEGLARAFCEALLPHLTLLQPLSPLGLRAQLGPDQVGYEAGAQGQPLPCVCQETLDCALVPLLSGPQEPMQLEMIFHVIYQ
ncbi:smad anchor for receptor activation isoform X1 [Haemaphysalis longicornis]